MADPVFQVINSGNVLEQEQALPDNLPDISPDDLEYLLGEGNDSGNGGVTGGGMMLGQGAAGIPSSQFADQLFPDLIPALICGAILPVKASKDHPITLRSGLDPDKPYGPNFADLSPVRSFLEDVWSRSSFLTPEKVMTFLDGGDGAMGFLGSFRKVRKAYLRAQYPSRRSSSVSSTAYQDSLYYARQILLMLIARALQDIVQTHSGLDMASLSADQKVDVLGFRDDMEAGGIEAIKLRIEEDSENAALDREHDILGEKKVALLSGNIGAPLCKKQKKELRDAGSSAKANEKRKQLHDLTRMKAQDILTKRWELRVAVGKAFYGDYCPAVPVLSASQQVAPTKQA